ncbi:serine protease inhibitor 88Ea-like [Nylanderia fulva]|uniref:serine protease inhibitor 88Ea-like n=1 Tax=Nylanderia fulva TaxID=613905 RepID=UPI0010FB0015|nr:serine protease inhibitor 88Ea-like [Nylanderia fulva]
MRINVKTDTSSTSLSILNEQLSTSEGMRINAKTDTSSISLPSLYERESTSEEMRVNAKTGTSSTSLSSLIERLSTTEGMRVLRKLLSFIDARRDSLDNTFAEDNQFVHFGNAVHRARVKVTEKNVTATAVTLISGQEPSSNDIISNMYLNYPFVWLIYDKMNADILYIGVFNEVDKCSVISDAMFQFALTSLHKYATIKSKEDFVFSPYSIYQELFSVYLISSGDIEQRLKNILYLPNVSKYELMKTLNFDAASNLPQRYAIQNKCAFLNTILRKNIEIIIKLYKCGFTSNESNNIQDINRKINKILKDLTKNYILIPLELKVRRKAMDIILTNIHNFYGQNLPWKLIFEPTNSRNSVDQCLSTSSYLNFQTFSSDELQVHVKELIIKKDFTSLFMLIPFSSSTDKRVKTDTSSTNLPSLIERLSTSEGMRILRKLLSCVKTDGSLSFATWPTFKIEKKLDMQVLLRELGVDQLMTPDAIPLDNTVAENDRSAHFGNAVHRARVKVTQEDVEATAVTVISGQEPSSNDIISNMYLNYPFVWLIYDKKNADIFYIGVFNEFDDYTGVLIKSTRIPALGMKSVSQNGLTKNCIRHILRVARDVQLNRRDV